MAFLPKFSFIKNTLITLTITAHLLCSVDFVQGAIEKTDKVIAANELLKKNDNITGKYFFTFRDKSFVGYPNVYSPVIFPGANKQGNIPIKMGDHFLEIGCGTGIFSVLAALDGAECVVAVDINSDAVANTIENAKLHGVDGRLKVIEGDMFCPLEKGSAFDIIFFNIPFCHINCNTKELSMLGKSLFDPEHDLLHRFFKEGQDYLRPNGRLILGYSTTHGDIQLMHEWADKYGWKTSLISKVGDETKDFITIELYELRR